MSMSPKHVYDYEIDLTGDTAPARVLAMVAPGARVLEIGAGPGSITKHLVDTLGCDVVAVDVDPDALAVLRTRCDRVYALDMNDPGWRAVLQGAEQPFDHVIAADVLEHVYDPGAVLGAMKALLAPTGSIILSLPHVSHAALLGCLLDEDMTYRDWGLLDRTHIRFFGLKNMQALLAAQDLAIEDAQFVVRTPEMTEFAEAWTRLPDDVRTALQRNRFSDVYQVVSRSAPAHRARRSLDLLDLPVPPPDAATARQLTQAMAALPPDPARDARSTLAPRPPVAAPGAEVRVIAFYLPQFHPTPENDLWWGKGFTEWTNVTKARPRFAGHHQPHLPRDLGFYDLRVREVLHEQIALAKAHGVDGFCYHYYWFSGQRLLDKPLEAMRADPEADMPYCLCWANESWTRRWDGGNNEILIAQNYRPEDDLAFIKSLEPHLRDARYIRVDGAPLLIVYRPQHMPDARTSARVWRRYCRDVGLGEIHIACALTHGNWDHLQFGFDAGVEFAPHNMEAPDLSPAIAGLSKPWDGYIPDYTRVAEQYLARRYSDARRVYRSVIPSWDNTARLGASGTILLNGTPENYEHWLSETLRLTRAESHAGDRLVFINAWNEWAEGCHLEPDQTYGGAFLEATLRATAGQGRTGWTHVGVPENLQAPAPPVDAAPRKSAWSRNFRRVRDTINGRRFK